MLYKLVSITEFRKMFFALYFYLGIALFFSLFFGFAIGSDEFSIFSSMLFIFTTTILSLNTNFRQSFISYVLCIFTMLFLTVPLVFYILNHSYEFGLGSPLLPYGQLEYKEVFPFAIIYLTLLWISLWLGIVSIKQTIKLHCVNNYQNIKLTSIFVFLVLILIITYFNNIDIKSIYSSDVLRVNSSLLVFIFWDDAFLMLIGLILFHKLNNSVTSIRTIGMVFMLIFFCFVVIKSSNAGSKAAFVVIFSLLFIYPISILNSNPKMRIVIPSKLVLMIAIMTVVPLFLAVYLQRGAAQAGINIEDLYLIDFISYLNIDSFYNTLESIFYRLSAGGLESFVFVFKSYSSFFPDITYMVSFLEYLFKSFINLIWIGTPYQEAFTPSSMFFSEYLHKQYFINDISNVNELIKSYNTQPYTLFGFVISIFGVIIAPIVVYIFGLIMSYLNYYLNNDLVKLSILNFFDGLLGLFGFELVMANSIHLFVSMLIMLFLLNPYKNYKRMMRFFLNSRFNT